MKEKTYLGGLIKVQFEDDGITEDGTAVTVTEESEETVYEIPEGCDGQDQYVAKVFGWMCIGVFLTALTTACLIFLANLNPVMVLLVADYPYILLTFLGAILLVEVFVAGILIIRVEKLPYVVAVALYLLYAVMNGFTVGFLLYISLGSAAIITTFIIAAVSFGIMAIFGMQTKQDLTGFGILLFFGLIGLIIALIVNIFLNNGILDILISSVGVIVFLGLTAYEAQSIKSCYQRSVATGDVWLINHRAIYAAFGLYLSFINLFIYITKIKKALK